MKLPGLGEKGKYATIIGIIIALVVTALGIVSFFLGMLTLLGLIFGLGYLISILFFILPSRINIEFGKFKASVED